MKIDNEKNYESLTCGCDQGTGGWAFSETEDPVETKLGRTVMVSNYHGLYGVVAAGLMLLVTDHWDLARNYIESLTK